MVSPCYDTVQYSTVQHCRVAVNFVLEALSAAQVCQHTAQQTRQTHLCASPSLTSIATASTTPQTCTLIFHVATAASCHCMHVHSQPVVYRLHSHCSQHYGMAPPPVYVALLFYSLRYRLPCIVQQLAAGHQVHRRSAPADWLPHTQALNHLITVHCDVGQRVCPTVIIPETKNKKERREGLQEHLKKCVSMVLHHQWWSWGVAFVCCGGGWVGGDRGKTSSHRSGQGL